MKRHVKKGFLSSVEVEKMLEKIIPPGEIAY